MPEPVFIEMTRKSKFDFSPTRISPSDIASRVLRQARTLMDSMIKCRIPQGRSMCTSRNVVTVLNASLGVNECASCLCTAVNQENTPIVKE